MGSLNLLERWFNYPPSPNVPFITDKTGEKFWLNWNELDSLDVWYRGRPVGRVNLDFREAGEVILADIIIFPHWFRGRLRYHGLGKAMLLEAIRYARERGAKNMRGWITPDETTTVEYLAEWYRLQGFEVFKKEDTYFIEKRIAN